MLAFLLLLFLVDEFDGLIEGDGHGVNAFGHRRIFAVEKDIGTETTGADSDRFTMIVTDLTGQLKQFQCLFESDGLDALVLRHLGERRFLVIVGSTNLHNRTETTDLHEDGLAALGILTQHTLTGLMLLTAVDGTFYRRFKLLVERVHHVRPLLITLGYLIEILLHLGSEVVIHNLCKVLHQEVIDHNTDIGRYQLTLRVFWLICLPFN